MTARKRPGVRHVDRLMQVLLEIAEDPNQDAHDRLAAAKEATTIIKNRRSPTHDKKKKAIEKMIGKPKPSE